MINDLHSFETIEYKSHCNINAIAKKWDEWKEEHQEIETIDNLDMDFFKDINTVQIIPEDQISNTLIQPIAEFIKNSILCQEKVEFVYSQIEGKALIITNKKIEEKINEIKDYIPANRLGSVEDVAACVEFLLSDTSKYITGEIIQIDGGLALR